MVFESVLLHESKHERAVDPTRPLRSSCFLAITVQHMGSDVSQCITYCITVLYI